MICRMRSDPKNSAGDRVPAMTLAKESMAGRLPCIAASNRCISSGGASKVASCVVKS